MYCLIRKKKTNKWERGRFVLWIFCSFYLGLPGDSVIKNLPANAGGRCGFNLWARKIPWRRKWQPTPVFLPGGSHGQRNLGALVNGVPKSWTQLSIHTHVHFTSQTLYRQEDKQTNLQSIFKMKERGAHSGMTNGISLGSPVIPVSLPRPDSQI